MYLDHIVNTGFASGSLVEFIIIIALNGHFFTHIPHPIHKDSSIDGFLS
nr:hypothetical protein [Candidatus Nanopusillus massiliensis]